MRISHIGWNISGLTLPLLVAALTVPRLIEELGHERFGLLALAWGLIGYAGALDLGIGRALTQRVAKLSANKKSHNITDTLATASRITLVSGLIGGLLVIAFAVSGGENLIQTNDTPKKDILISIILLAVALPAQAMCATYKGVNEAFMNFKGISLLRAGLGAINFAGPFFVSMYTTQLPWLISTLVVSRILSLFIYRKMANSCLLNKLSKPVLGYYSKSIARDLFSFGGWVTISSIISPIMVQADRFLIASLVSASAVSLYVIPYEIVIQSLVIVGAISSVMFPALIRLINENQVNWMSYLKLWVNRVGLLMACVCILISLLLPFVLNMWIGESLDAESILVGRILCAGVFFSSLGAMYYAAIHAHGRADVTAKFHLLQFPIFIFLMQVFIHKWGIVGAAIAWSIRTSVDAIGLMIFVNKKLKG